MLRIFFYIFLFLTDLQEMHRTMGSTARRLKKEFPTACDEEGMIDIRSSQF